ncbi:unnamed protein product [Mytilus coruscus]|uniref:Retrotransposon gag domain-containing protein n=1 Tax=Mytilus coruscus TaxID=42192 RepID=A0A6J8DP11_MYTCO|nr:unnamed protein product [Mytilus coruscus]
MSSSDNESVLSDDFLLFNQITDHLEPDIGYLLQPSPENFNDTFILPYIQTPATPSWTPFNKFQTSNFTNSTDSKQVWQTFEQVYKQQYLDVDFRSPAILLEGEIFEILKLAKGQSIDDFYAQLLEKATIFRRNDHEILIKFIKGLPDQLAFFVRTGHHSDSASYLAAAKMREAYGYRKDDAPLVAAATKTDDNTYVAVKDLNNFKTDVVSELQGRINSLTQAVSKLATDFSQQLDCTRDVKGNYHFPRPRNRNRQTNGSLKSTVCKLYGKPEEPGVHMARPPRRQLKEISVHQSAHVNISNNTVPDSDHEHTKFHQNHYSSTTECTSDDDLAFVCKFLYMPVRIANLEILALIDTGGSMNVMSSQFFNSIPDSMKFEFSATNDKISLANNQIVQIYGTATVKISVPQGKHWIPQYNFEIQYKPAREMEIPDALSRCTQEISNAFVSPDENDPFFPYEPENTGQIIIPGVIQLTTLLRDSDTSDSKNLQLNNICLPAPVPIQNDYDADTEDIDQHYIHVSKKRKPRKTIQLSPRKKYNVLKESEPLYIYNPDKIFNQSTASDNIQDSDKLFEQSTDINDTQAKYTSYNDISDNETTNNYTKKRDSVTGSDSDSNVNILTSIDIFQEKGFNVDSIHELQRNDAHCRLLIQYLERNELPKLQKEANRIRLLIPKQEKYHTKNKNCNYVISYACTSRLKSAYVRKPNPSKYFMDPVLTKLDDVEVQDHTSLDEDSTPVKDTNYENVSDISDADNTRKSDNIAFVQNNKAMSRPKRAKKLPARFKDQNFKNFSEVDVSSESTSASQLKVKRFLAQKIINGNRSYLAHVVGEPAQHAIWHQENQLGPKAKAKLNCRPPPGI